MKKRSKKVNGNGHVSKYTVRTTSGLCEALFDEFDLLRNGQSDAPRTAAVAKMATTIMATKYLEMEAARLVKEGFRMRAVMLEPNRRLAVLK